MPDDFRSCRPRGYRSQWIAHFMAKGCSEAKAISMTNRKSTPTYRKPFEVRT